MVFQHFSLFDALTAAENIALSLDDDTPIATIAAKAQALSHSYGLPLDPYSLVGDLSVGERQRIEIIRCLLQTPQLIILDEPTSVLTPQEADKLFETLERLRSEGKSILYISHRLEEVKRMCDARDRPAPRQGGRPLRSAQGDGGLARPHDGRQRGAGRGARSRSTAWTRRRRCSRSRNLSRKPATPFSMPLQQHHPERARRRGHRHRRRRRQRPGRVLRGGLRRGDAAGRRHRSASAARTPGRLGITGRRLLGAAFVPEERLGHGAAPRMKLSENLLLSRHATDGKAFLGAGGIVKDRRDRRGRAAHHRGDGRAQERARSRGGGAVGRQSAEIHHRPRTRPPADRDGRQPADLGRRCGRRGQDPAVADRSGAQRLGGAGHQPGSRRTVRDLRRASPSCTMASCRSRCRSPRRRSRRSAS